MTFRRFNIEWTREKAGRFWDFIAERAADSTYFSHAAGSDLVRTLRSRGVIATGSRVLDFGCGPGFLMRELARAGVQCHGADFDARSLERARRRLDNHPEKLDGLTLISSLPSALPANDFDVVLCVETIEHLIGDELPKTIAELMRVLRPGGKVVVTCPNEEDLASNSRMCPDCGCVFHQWQHVSSWSHAKLRATMEAHGFETRSCEARTFFRASLLQPVRKLRARLAAHEGTNLLYIGAKRR